MINKVQIGRELFDTRVPGVYDINLTQVIDRNIAGLHEKAFFLGSAAGSEWNQWGIMICHVEKQWTVFDGTIKNQDLEVKEKNVYIFFQAI